MPEDGIARRKRGKKMAIAEFQTMVDAFIHSTEDAPDHTAVIVGDDQATYGEYRAAAAGLSAQLDALGANGERVVVLMANFDPCHSANFFSNSIPFGPVQ